MKKEKLDKIINAMSEDEKIRALYRLQLIELNKRLSSVHNRVNTPSDSYSAKRVRLYHSFYDGNTVNSERYNTLQRALSKNKNICDYLNSFGVYAYAVYVYELCTEFRSSNDYEHACRCATELKKTMFNERDIQLLDKEICIDLIRLKLPDRNYVVQELKEQLNIKDLYHDFTIAQKFKLHGPKISKEQQIESYEELEQMLKDYLEEEQRLEEERADLERRNDGYRIPDEDEYSRD